MQTFKTRTQDEMHVYNFTKYTLLIRLMKAHTRWNALNELFCCINKRITLSKIKVNLNCGEMRSIKPPFNLHRILEFGFRNTSLDKLLPIPQILELANYQRAFCGKLPKGGAERSTPLTCSGSGSFSFSPFIVPKFAHTTHVLHEILL